MNVQERNTGYALVLGYASLLVWAWVFDVFPEWALLFASWVFYLLATSSEVRYRVLLALAAATGCGLAAATSAVTSRKDGWTIAGMCVPAAVGYVYLIRVIKNTTILSQGDVKTTPAALVEV
jgi:hypothetical protein